MVRETTMTKSTKADANSPLLIAARREERKFDNFACGSVIVYFMTKKLMLKPVI